MQGKPWPQTHRQIDSLCFSINFANISPRQDSVANINLFSPFRSVNRAAVYGRIAGLDSANGGFRPVARVNDGIVGEQLKDVVDGVH